MTREEDKAWKKFIILMDPIQSRHAGSQGKTPGGQEAEDRNEQRVEDTALIGVAR